MWDAVEIILKASLRPNEDGLLGAWVRGYRFAMTCFPRLHVITEERSLRKAATAFAGVPNVTFRANELAPAILRSTNRSNSYFIIQWHIVWADNFTSAPYIMFFDVDATPILPFRCQHFFDDQDRVLLHAWHRPEKDGTHWTRPTSNVFLKAQAQHGEVFKRNFTTYMQDLDFMNFWPIMAPRSILPTLRRLVSQVRLRHERCCVLLQCPTVTSHHAQLTASPAAIEPIEYKLSIVVRVIRTGIQHLFRQSFRECRTFSCRSHREDERLALPRHRPPGSLPDNPVSRSRTG